MNTNMMIGNKKADVTLPKIFLPFSQNIALLNDPLILYILDTADDLILEKESLRTLRNSAHFNLEETIHSGWKLPKKVSLKIRKRYHEIF